MLRSLASIFIAAIISTAALAAKPPLNIYIASDSTAQTYKPDRYPQAGWGQMLPCAFGRDVVIHNEAIAGRSTKTFIAEGRLDRIAHELEPGDTLLIQFGHNDADRNPAKGRYADPDGAYRDNLIRMIEVARVAGAQPVLITPVIRRHFVDGQVRADFAPWSNEVRKIAADRKVPLIDLEALSGAWIQKTGEAGSKLYYLHYTPEDHAVGFPKGVADDTHFSELGARRVAEIIAGELRALKLPISRRVLRVRPALTRAEPLGSTSCN
jgi:lysophospholipase L1-like esterase